MRIGLFASVAVAGFVIGVAEPSRSADDAAPDVLTLSTICGNEADGSGGSTPVTAAPPKMLPGFGNGGFTITTSKPEAQRWFTYGIQLAQAFAHEPAKAAFREAARLDPDCAMCVWGQAMADGPTINYGISSAERTEAGMRAVKAQQLGAGGTDKERRLLAAMVRRYVRSGGDAAYAADMVAIARAWPDDDALQVLAAEALMDTGKKPRVREANTILETVLTRNPTHVGAIHFYIHSSEWTDVGYKAEPFADRLGMLAPGASHLIHMPSHTYYRVGRYRDAGRVNVAAIGVDKAWMTTVGWTKPMWKIGYFGHNVRFALGGAMMAGDAEAALTIADMYAGVPAEDLAKSPWAQSSAASAWFAQGRYADPDKVLAMTAPSDTVPLVRAMWRYARGEALARKGDAKGVLAEAAGVRLSSREMAAFKGDGGAVAAMLLIAHETLVGRAAMLDGRYRDAAAAYRKAATRQKKAFGDGGDPPMWWYPTRRGVAAALLADGKPAEALVEANAVLAGWPKDPMTLVVVSRAEAALGHQPAAAEALAKARAGWSGAPLDGVSLNGI